MHLKSWQYDGTIVTFTFTWKGAEMLSIILEGAGSKIFRKVGEGDENFLQYL